MSIRPYGSKKKPCVGEYVGTIRHGDRVVNTTIFVIKDEVETLLSGPVCEELGIINFNETQVSAVKAGSEEEDPEKVSIMSKFPRIFKGLGKLKGVQIKLHVNKKVRPVAEQARPISFHLIKKRDEALAKMQ